MLDERWGSDEQDLADGLRGLLEKVCDPAAVRAAEADGGRSSSLESALDGFGLWDLPLEPGLMAVASLELGRALAPVPFPERLAAEAAGASGCVFAEQGWAPAGYDAVVVAEDGTLVQATTSNPVLSAAGDQLATVAATKEVVGDTDAADRARRTVRLLAAARAAGAAEGALAIGVRYAAERHQFGRPIGSFQAVAHRLADAAVAADGASLGVRKAAWVAAPEQGGDGAPPAIFATIARYAADGAAEAAVAATHQVMGGYGFTTEYDCQLYSRRTRAWRLRLAPIGPELAELAQTLIDPERRGAVRWLWHHEAGLPLPRWAAEADG